MDGVLKLREQTARQRSSQAREKAFIPRPSVTPQPGTRRGVKRGCHTSGLRLFNLFFLIADTCIHMHNLCNNKNSFYIYIIHTTIVAFIIFYTHILESFYFYYYNFTITKLYI